MHCYYFPDVATFGNFKDGQTTYESECVVPVVERMQLPAVSNFSSTCSRIGPYLSQFPSYHRRCYITAVKVSFDIYDCADFSAFAPQGRHFDRSK